MSVDEKGRNAARQAIRYLSSPSTPWSDEQVASVLEAYLAAALPAQERPCTCHPDDNPPQPCARKYALTDCRAATSPAGDLVERIEYHVNNPSAWPEGFDHNISDLLREAAQALRHQSTGVTEITDEMVERALQAWFDQGVVAERLHPQHQVAMRAALSAALSAQERG